MRQFAKDLFNRDVEYLHIPTILKSKEYETDEFGNKMEIEYRTDRQCLRHRRYTETELISLLFDYYGSDRGKYNLEYG